MFDTAAAYWDSEEVIWRFVKKNNLAWKINIITKLLPNVFDKKTGNINNVIEEEIRWSLNRLNIPIIYWYLLHTPAYIYNDEVLQWLMKAKKKWLIKNFWVSIYEPEDALYAVKNTGIDYIQIPYNVFDQRLDKSDFFSIIQNKWIKVFARTAFVQWLIFMKDEEIPWHLSEAKWYLHDFDIIINKYGLSRLQAALLFVYNHKYIDHAVVWVETVQQIAEDIEVINKQIDLDKCYQELKNKFSDVNKIIFFPSLWAKK